MSRIEVHGTDLVVCTGATLPPVCMVTGQVMPLAEAKYLVTYLGVMPEHKQMDAHGNLRRTPQIDARALVRLPFSAAGLRKRNFWSRMAPVWMLAGVALLLGTNIYLDRTGHVHPGPRWGQLGGVLVGFAILIGGLKWILGRDAATHTARALTDGRVAISGIDMKILRRMLEWQQKHSSSPRA